MMSDVTRILNAIEQGDVQAAEELLPLIYEELRLLAAQKLSQERPGQTLNCVFLLLRNYHKNALDRHFRQQLLFMKPIYVWSREQTKIGTAKDIFSKLPLRR
jgi:hypothetical protein